VLPLGSTAYCTTCSESVPYEPIGLELPCKQVRSALPLLPAGSQRQVVPSMEWQSHGTMCSVSSIHWVEAIEHGGDGWVEAIEHRRGWVQRVDAPRGVSTGCWGPICWHRQKGSAICRWSHPDVGAGLVSTHGYSRYEGTPSNPSIAVRLPPYRMPCLHQLPLSVETGLGPSTRTTRADATSPKSHRVQAASASSPQPRDYHR
jgi:hypothetical protein